MPFTLDTTRPTIVVVGSWNNSILSNPTWMARHAFGLEMGMEIEGKHHVSIDSNGLKREVFEFDHLVWSVQGNRLEFFSRDPDDDEKICATLSRLAECLPHTPVAAIGANFSFANSTPSEEDLNKIRNYDEFSDIGKIQSVSTVDSVELPREVNPKRDCDYAESVIMKIERKTDLVVLDYSFNFHTDLGSISDLKLWCAGAPIDHWREFCRELIISRFGGEFE